MKMKALLLLTVLLLTSLLLHAQKNQDPSIINVITIDGNQFKGEITYEDSALIVLTTKTMGPITIQKKNIKYQGAPDSFAQLRKNGISVNLLGASPLFGLTYERLLARFLSLEVGLGIFGVGAGVKVYPFKAKEGKAIFHTGITRAAEAISRKTVTYVPLGISYFSRGGFNFGIDLGPAYYGDNGGPDEGFSVYGNLKLGIRF